MKQRRREETDDARCRRDLWRVPSPGKRHVHRIEEDVMLTTPAEVARFLSDRLFQPFDEIDQEELWVLLLTAKNKATHVVMPYRGLVSGTQIRVAEVFKDAVRVNAPAIVVAHCHPSGDPTPSENDVRMTSQLVEAGNLLGIDVLDHVIIGDGCFASMRERGLGFQGA